MDINWDQIQQILTFLIIFIAPAILSRFKKEEDEDEQDQRPGGLKIEDLVGHKPVVLKDIQKEQESKAHQIKIASHKKKEKQVQKTQPARPIKRESQRPTMQVDREKMMALNESFKPKPAHKSVSLLGMSPKKAMVLKEILGPPRGMDPY